MVFSRRLKSTLHIILALIFCLTLLVPGTILACQMWGMVSSSGFLDSAYTYTVNWYRWHSVGMINGWGFVGVDQNQAHPIVYHSIENLWDPWTDEEEGGLSIEYPPDVNYDGTEDTLLIAISHARRGSTGRTDIANPHPFYYSFNGRTLAMCHNGTLRSGWWTQIRNLMLDEYWALDMFDRQWRGDFDNHRQIANDSELYAMLLMKHVLLADNYELGDSWAINRTISLLITKTGGGSKNILFMNGTQIYGVRSLGPALKYSQNDVDPSIWCVVSGGSPDSGGGFSEWTPLNYYGSYIILEGDSLINGPHTLEDVEIPDTREFLINRQSFSSGGNPTIAAGPNSDFISVWENTSAHSITYRYLNQMGLGQRLEKTVASSNLEHYRNPDIAFDPETNDFYVVYEAKAYNRRIYNQIKIKKFTYDQVLQDWIAEEPQTINTISDEVVRNPALAFGGGTWLVSWEQCESGEEDWQVHTCAGWNNGGMSERLIGSYLIESVQQYPAVTYLKSRQANPRFVISYTLTAGSGDTEGIYLGSIYPKTASENTRIPAYAIDLIDYRPEVAKPSLSVAGDDFICAYTRKPNSTTTQIVTNRFRVGFSELSVAGWEYPTETTSINYSTNRFNISSDVTVSGRPSGSYDVVYSSHDWWTDEDNIYVLEYEIDANDQPEPQTWDQSRSSTDRQPAMAIAPDFLGGDQDRRMVIWLANNADGENPGIIGRFSQDQFEEPDVEEPGNEPEPGEEQPDFSISLLPLPHTSALHTPFPNPFNPLTTIRFSLANPAKTEIEVLNIQGQRVETLVNGYLTSGLHRIVFEASTLPAGTYFIRMVTPGYNEVKRVILVR
ncbi:MAG: T9SS type A sorting domain-containing protein [Candidatus Electryonea clarkiae]|nr:T9SS type A sorting domain-containing protein [Candidatus Electryonea clarkiae]MDP8288100.1 T9SS type A sorting domain-containing protein [Candidatus Electryonea clarkiae]